MLICDEFLMLNLPKTGSSFARSAIKEVFRQRSSKLNRVLYNLRIKEPPLKEYLTHNLYIPGRRKGQHGTYIQIPEKYRDKDLVSVVRNPFTKFISGYEYQFWVKRPPLPKALIESEFPSFPNLSLDQFVDFSMKAADLRSNSTNKMRLGMQTLQFIQMFFKEPSRVIANIDEAYLSSDKKYRSDMADVTLLRQEYLRHDLCEFLKHKGFSEEELNIIKNYRDVNRTKRKATHRSIVWTQKALDFVKINEGFLLKILEDKGYTYNVPDVGSATR